MQKVRVRDAIHHQQYWRFNQNYLIDPVYDEYDLNIRGTDRLLESHSTRFPVRAKGENVTGGGFHVLKMDLTSSNSLGYDPRHFGVFPGEPARPGQGAGHVDGYHLFGNLYLDELLSEGTRPVAEYSSKPTMAALSATAIARSLPTNPIANLSGTLAEAASEGMLSPVQLDSMRGKTAAARNAGGSYLNYQFGWAPVVSDVKKLLHSVVNFGEIAQRYIDNAGRDLKGSYEFEPKIETSEEVTNGVYLRPAQLQFLSRETGTLVSTITHRKRQWFEGVFCYYLPSSLTDPVAYHSALANKALGTRLTPETVWNLAPWSWAGDWFANTGDVIHNVVAFQNDGLVMKRGYMMETCTCEKVDTLMGIETITYGPVTFHQTSLSTSKQRVVANPYYWGSEFDGLSGRQKAILIALGLSRA